VTTRDCLSDNGPSYVAGEYIEANKMSHVRGAAMHPQTQGKIERWHQTLKYRILLENYFLPGDLERQIGAFIEHCNHQRYHESLNNVTPADAYFGRAQAIIQLRERIKRRTVGGIALGVLLIVEDVMSRVLPGISVFTLWAHFTWVAAFANYGGLAEFAAMPYCLTWWKRRTQAVAVMSPIVLLQLALPLAMIVWLWRWLSRMHGMAGD
jgi:Integrase core domain